MRSRGKHNKQFSDLNRFPMEVDNYFMFAYLFVC